MLKRELGLVAAMTVYGEDGVYGRCARSSCKKQLVHTFDMIVDMLWHVVPDMINIKGVESCADIQDGKIQMRR